MTKDCKTWEPSHHNCSVSLNHNLASRYSIFPGMKISASLPHVWFPVSPCQFCSSRHNLLSFHVMYMMIPEAVSSFCMVWVVWGFFPKFWVLKPFWLSAARLQPGTQCSKVKWRHNQDLFSSFECISAYTRRFGCKIYTLFYPWTNFNLSFSLVTLLFTKLSFFSEGFSRMH